jgi:hypothetical protein
MAKLKPGSNMLTVAASDRRLIMGRLREKAAERYEATRVRRKHLRIR